VDTDELHNQRAERVAEVEVWLEPEVQGRAQETSITRACLRDEDGVYWQIRGLADAPVLLGVSERALDTYNGDQIASTLRDLEALDAAIARVTEAGPGNGVLLRQKELVLYDFTR